MKFLIVADNPDGLQRIAQGLQKEFPGAGVVAALRQEDFVQAVARGDFDLAISEYRLSWGDGLWVFGTIRGRLPDVPVIMVADSGSEEVAAVGVKVGLSDYVLRENLRRLPMAARESLEKAGLRQREHTLQKTHDELELRVQERTLELLNAIELLKREIVERKRGEEQVRESRRRLRVLSQKLVEAQEAERRNLARELHDEVGQALTAVKVRLRAMQEMSDTDAVARDLNTSIDIVEGVLQQVRDLSLSLRPPLLDDLGLMPALRWYMSRLREQVGLAAQLVFDPPEGRFPPAVETTCFRVAQEALTNTVRHARAGRVRIEVQRRDADLHLVVRDDGVGFDVDAALRRAAEGGSLGLPGMQERVRLVGGRLEIESVPGYGTEVRAWIPFFSDTGPDKFC